VRAKTRQRETCSRAHQTVTFSPTAPVAGLSQIV